MNEVIQKTAYKPVNMKISENETGNLLNREFKRKNLFEILVSDLTYVRVKSKWNYICLFVDVFNREIVGIQCWQEKEGRISIQGTCRDKSKFE